MMRNSFKIGIAFIAVALSLFFLLPAESQQYLMSSQIFNQIFDADTDSIRISIDTETLTGDLNVGDDIILENDEVIDNDTNGTVQVQSATALTNAVSPEFSLLHETSGTPANGIGTGISFVQETSASNNETGMSLDAVVTDATAASEDFKFSVQLMAAGAAKAEVFSVASTGDVTASGGADFGGSITLANDETISNGTNGQIDLNGNAYLNGAVKYKAACTIADGDATPDIAGCAFAITSANTGATEITDLDNPVVGSVVTLIGGSATNSSTITDGGNFNLSAGWTAGLDDILVLYVQADNDYIEISRSNN